MKEHIIARTSWKLRFLRQKKKILWFTSSADHGMVRLIHVCDVMKHKLRNWKTGFFCMLVPFLGYPVLLHVTATHPCYWHVLSFNISFSLWIERSSNSPVRSRWPEPIYMSVGCVFVLCFLVGAISPVSMTFCNLNKEWKCYKFPFRHILNVWDIGIYLKPHFCEKRK